MNPNHSPSLATALLLDISIGLATIRDRDVLKQFIMDRVRPMFGFNEYLNIGIPTADGQALTYFFTQMRTDAQQQESVQGFGQRIPIVGIFAQLMETADVVVTDQRWKTNPKAKPVDEASARIWQELDFNVSLSIALRHAGRFIGTWHVHFFDEPVIDDDLLRLFKAIANLLAVSVSTILVVEEIVCREKQKGELLEISTAISQISDREGLLKTILKKIQPIFGFSDTALFIVDTDWQHYRMWFDTLQEPYEEGRMSTEGPAIPMSNPVIDYCLDDKPPRIIDRTNMLELAASIPSVMHWIADSGTQEVLVGTLKVGGRVIGCFNAHSKIKGKFDKSKLPLYQNVCEQISIAVANILANEKILERERQKSQLLSITQSIATITNIPHFWKTINDTLKPVFLYDTATVIVFDKEMKNYRHIESATHEQNKSDSNKNIGNWSPIENSPYELLLNDNFSTAIYSLSDLIGLYPNHWGLQMAIKFNLHSWMIAPLYQSGKVIGILEYLAAEKGFWKNSHLPLFKNLGDQIAIAVANILANEEILLRERETALQMAVIETIAGPGSWTDRLERVANLLQPMLPFHLFHISLEEAPALERSYTYWRMGENEYQVIDHDAFLRIVRLSSADYLRYRNLETFDRPQWQNGTDFENRCHQQFLTGRMAQTWPLAAHLGLAMPLQTGRVVLRFFSKQPDAYAQSHLNFLQKLMHGLSQTVEKLLAFEQIERLKDQLEQEKKYLIEEIKSDYNFDEIIGSTSLRNVFDQVRQVGPTDTTVLILGETGTGKELIARALHNASPRRNRVLVKLNCAALPAQLIESELFGHEKGAFTGAVDRRMGKFELANGGTIFLDEIGEMAIELQAKLLRVLQEREFERLGGKVVLKADVRVLAATNRDLLTEVQQGRFRADLYYRLSIFPIELPALRQRRDDISELATYFGQKFSQRMKLPFRGIRDDALQELLVYDWPGNIRELENLIEQAVIVGQGLRPLSWARQLTSYPTPVSLARPLHPMPTAIVQPQTTYSPEWNQMLAVLTETNGKVIGKGGAAERLGLRPHQLEAAERTFLLSILAQTDGRIRGKGGAAARLAVKPTTLESRMARLGIRREHVVKH